MLRVIIAFGRSEGPRMECNRVEFSIGRLNGVYCRDGIVQGIGLDDLWRFRNPMREDRGGGEGELVESALAVGVETPWCVLSEKVGHWDNNIRVPWDKATVEIHKTEEGLDIADIAGFRPVQNYLYFLLVHADTCHGAVET
jgi:hypothetical protein